jgi:hypothetical protein
VAISVFKAGFMRFQELAATRQAPKFELPVDIGKSCPVWSSTHDLDKGIWNRLARHRIDDHATQTVFVWI